MGIGKIATFHSTFHSPLPLPLRQPQPFPPDSMSKL